MERKADPGKPPARHLQYSQDSWTEVDAEGTDSEMAEGRQSEEPFYTPLVTEAAERRLARERQLRLLDQMEEERGGDGDGEPQE